MSSSAHEFLTALRSAREQLEGLHRYDKALAVCAAGLARMQAVLARPPRVVILGEVNSGKTSVADLLLGVGLLPSSVVANTRLPVLIRYAEETALHAVAGDTRWLVTGESLDGRSAGPEVTALEIALPSERLKEFEILDTPARADWNGASTDGDIRIWCTVATRAWTESERVYWSGLPRRNWRNALLVATHKDALEEASDATKIEWRLRAAAGEMFRDILLVSATDAGKSRRTNGRPSDASAVTLLGQVRVWAAEIRERRARKVEKIVRRLARLTFHRLARGTLRLTEARILREWEGDCSSLIDGMGSASGDLASVMRELLRRFARAMELARSGSIERQIRWPGAATDAGTPQRGAPSRRFVKLIAADLTTLLRIELARGGLRDPTLFADYEAAQRILLPLARLDLEFDVVESLLASGRPLEAAVAAPSIEQVLLSLSRAR
ncbi:MAG: dynamin family protein [Hyphomicrobium sp.]